MPFGYQLLIDMYECEGKTFFSFEACYQFLEDLCKLLKMNKQSPPFLFRSDETNYPEKAGLSGWLPLIESGIQIHTIEPQKFASLDVYSCKHFDPDEVIEFTKKSFVPKALDHYFIYRGKRYVFSQFIK
jgi:S-adenosylmethionine decarboxylase